MAHLSIRSPAEGAPRRIGAGAGKPLSPEGKGVGVRGRPLQRLLPLTPNPSPLRGRGVGGEGARKTAFSATGSLQYAERDSRTLLKSLFAGDRIVRHPLPD